MNIQTTNSRFFRARVATCLGILPLFRPMANTAQQGDVETAPADTTLVPHLSFVGSAFCQQQFCGEYAINLK
jgi:hypothetical protein